jgi:hypothetical protein
MPYRFTRTSQNLTLKPNHWKKWYSLWYCLPYFAIGEELAENIAAMRAIDMLSSAKLQIELIKRVNTNVEAIHAGMKSLHEAYEKAHHADSLRAEADIFCHAVRPQMEAIRAACG